MLHEFRWKPGLLRLSAMRRKGNSSTGYTMLSTHMPQMWNSNDKTIKVEKKMPRGDGTGPMGMGSMTGRAAGYCAGFNMPGYANPDTGRDFAAGVGRKGLNCGRGFYGGGHGRRNIFYATSLPGWLRGQCSLFPQMNAFPENEVINLKSLETSIVEQLEEIRKRISELTKP
jgi:hypothetical protein